ncbi:methyl-accepting chemotaxis protein [Thiomicrospira sp. ALE5]|uniref:methyl-accepting chemotaxis protein n=1 Tax=Thiomicrospira sp. ALE5 TaxID=748650 RepID=UPI0008F2BC3F|nr:methyl-accepting chemotaxis protein [Thiomicrospira sp. ALE5]SFR56292.1 methyl-accepting chemotaxis protein [Thiomicrospira sp. ALE5]
MSFLSSSLKASFLFFTSLLLVVCLALFGSLLYWFQVKPIEQTQLQQAQRAMAQDIDQRMQARVETVMAVAMAAAQNQVIQDALMGRVSRDVALKNLEQTRDHFRTASKGTYGSIQMHVFDREQRSFIKSWAPNSFGEEIRNPMVRSVFEEQKFAGSVTLTRRGPALLGVSPVIVNNEVIGAVAVTGGFGVVVRELVAESNIDWLMLWDTAYIENRYPALAETVSQNPSYDQRYVVGHTQWFSADFVSDLMNMNFAALDAEQTAVMLKGDAIFINIPAYDELGQVLGRNIFRVPADELNALIAQQQNQVLLTLFIIFLVVMLIVGMLIALVQFKVINPVANLSATMLSISRTGQFSQRAAVNSQDEVGQMAAGFNTLLAQTQNAVNETNSVIEHIARGDFSPRVVADLQGDLLTLKTGVNQSADSIQLTMSALSDAMSALQAGNFSLKLDSQEVSGEYKTMLDLASQAMAQLHQTIQGIAQVMDAMQQGQYQQRVEVNAVGELANLKAHINRSMDSLESALVEIVRVIDAQSRGDLTQKIEKEYQGELRVLQEAVNQTANKLTAVVNKALQASVVVNQASSEVATGANDLSMRVQQQAAAIEETSATMDQMTSAVAQSRDNSEVTATITLDVQHKAHEGVRVMRETIDVMTGIQASSQQIAEIVSLIDSIAFQTNLLALNAAVEAARAGEHGRGFAVVASEVRALAQKSADAAKDIKQLIEDSVERIDRGTELANKSGESLEEVNQAIEEVVHRMKEIATAASEQSLGISQVHQAINQIDSVTQQNAALVEQTSATTETLNDQARALAEDMAFFKTQQSVQTHALLESK